MDRAVVLVPLTGDDPPGRVDDALDHLVEAADEASAAGLPTTLLLVPVTQGAPAGDVLTSWEPLVALLDDVDLALADGPPPGGDWWSTGLRQAEERCPATGRTVVLTTSTRTAVGPDWIVAHVRHLRGGALAATGPVLGGGGTHEPLDNLAVRLDVALAGRGSGHPVPATGLVHAVDDPVVRSLHLGARTSS